MRFYTFFLCPVFFLLAVYPAHYSAEGREVRVQNGEELRRALLNLRPGTTVSIAPGEYPGGHHVQNASGTAKKPVVIKGLDPENPPVFTGGGSQAFHFAGSSHFTLAHVEVRGYSANGINIDDGGSFDTPARGVTVEHVTVRETGPRGNHDALKLSGLLGFRIRDCSFEGWGGSAVDMVGCREGVVERCRFIGKEGFSTSNAIQMKGGTRKILVHLSFFKDCGHRCVNLGGSTGLAYFRPSVGDFEAKEITVAGNRFVGAMAGVAFATADGGHVHHNTFYLQEKWVLRILQETKDPRFKRCTGGKFEHNLVVYDGRVRVFVNVGPNTEPETFTFHHNAWFSASGRGRKPTLPAPEKNGVWGVDPKLQDPGTETMRIGSPDPRLRGIGADAYRPLRTK
jgi:hypothetical protein